MTIDEYVKRYGPRVASETMRVMAAKLVMSELDKRVLEEIAKALEEALNDYIVKIN